MRGLARYVWVPILGAVLYLGVRVVVATTAEAAVWVNRIVPGAFLILAFVGTTLAAAQFKRGDYLRPAWALIGYGFACIAASRLLSGPDPPRVLRLALTIASNALEIAGTVLLARTWRVAGLELTPRRRGVHIGVIVFALLVVGAPIVANIRDIVTTGRLSAWHGVVSATGDLITFALLAPIALTAWALRGGLTTWPWLYYTAAILCWLIYDLKDTVTLFMPGDNPDWLITLVEPFRIAAAGFAFAAGMSQRWLVRHDPGEHAPGKRDT